LLTYAIYWLLFFLMTGFAIARVAGFGNWAFALALPFSYLFLILNVLVATLTAMPVGWLAIALAAQVVLLFVLLVHGMRGSMSEYASIVKLASEHAHAIIASAFLLLGFGTYLVIVGPYTEVPSDFWVHIGKMQHEYLELARTGRFASPAEWSGYLGKDGAWWYVLQALLIYLSGITVVESFAVQSVLNSLTLLAAYYWFVTRILAAVVEDRRTVLVVSALAVVLFAVHQGTNVFAFIRYYTFGPVFLNTAIYFIFIALFLDMLRVQEMRTLRWLSVSLSIVALMAVVHLQEALFALILIYTVPLVICYQRLRAERLGQGNVTTASAPETVQLVLWLVLMSTVLGATALFVWTTYDRYDPLAFSRVIELQQILPFLCNLYILDPSRQFYETYALWGYVVLALFIIRIEWFRASPYLLAGMLSPLVTVFNPLFVDLFLRLSYPWILWRFLFMAPLTIVGAFLIYRAFTALTTRRTVAQRFAGVITLLVLVLPLFPLQSIYLDAPYSRFQTLKAVAPDNDYRNWTDLIDWLNGLEQRYPVMTDPVTGYMVRALTDHDETGRKFDTIQNPGYLRLTRGAYDLERFKRFKGNLVILNLRAGGHSRTGELSRPLACASTRSGALLSGGTDRIHQGASITLSQALGKRRHHCLRNHLKPGRKVVVLDERRGSGNARVMRS
jgi:hypothetical protein